MKIDKGDFVVVGTDPYVGTLNEWYPVPFIPQYRHQVSQIMYWLYEAEEIVSAYGDWIVRSYADGGTTRIAFAAAWGQE